jgi:glycosyltransferase involved in cell wall biosynthesis
VTAPRIFVYNADNGGCGHYRVIWPAEALIAQGADVQIINLESESCHQVQATYWTGDDGTRTLLKVDPIDCDIAVLQRPLTDTLAAAVPMLQAHGIKVVIEIDDDFESISPRNVSWHNVRPPAANDPFEVRIKRERRNLVNLRRACEQADLVVVSTPALADVYGRHGRVAVVPNCVPEVYLWTFGEHHDGVRIGWSGSIDTHPDDLQVTRGAVQRAMRSTGAEFRVVGTGKGVKAALNLTSPPSAAGWQPIDRYPVEMAGIDVGIVPLQMSRFNEAKSWLKGLEFAALGVPFVASPTGPYLDLLVRGAGLVAATPKDWEHMLKRLVRNDGERLELAEAGREAAQSMTIEGNCDRWYEAWASVVNTRAATLVA